MSQTRSVDYARYAKWGFFLGVALFAIGGGGEIVGHALYGSLPAWENALFFDLEVVGLLVGFFSPLVFGIALPLLE